MNLKERFPDADSGLILDSTVKPPTALRDGANVSWLPSVLVGDDQGQEDSCTIHAIANLIEIMENTSIPDADCLKVFRETRSELGRDRGGLTYREAIKGCKRVQWLGPDAWGEPQKDLSALPEQPLLLAYAVTDAFHNVDWKTGCLDHDPRHTRVYGGHAVCGVADGRVVAGGERWIKHEGSWGLRWGWKGIGAMRADLHQRLCMEVWKLCNWRV